MHTHARRRGWKLALHDWPIPHSPLTCKEPLTAPKVHAAPFGCCTCGEANSHALAPSAIRRALLLLLFIPSFPSLLISSINHPLLSDTMGFKRTFAFIAAVAALAAVVQAGPTVTKKGTFSQKKKTLPQ